MLNIPKGHKLVGVNAFYKANTENKIVFTLSDTDVPVQMEDAMQILMREYDRMWNESVRTNSTQDLTLRTFSALDRIADDRHDSYDLESAVLIIGCLYMLEKVGKLKADQHNGLEFLFNKIQ